MSLDRFQQMTSECQILRSAECNDQQICDSVFDMNVESGSLVCQHDEHNNRLSILIVICQIDEHVAIATDLTCNNLGKNNEYHQIVHCEHISTRYINAYKIA